MTPKFIFASLFCFQIIFAQTSNDLVNDGISLLNSGGYEASIEKFTKAIELDSNNKYAYGNRGLARRNLKKYKTAIKDYDRAIKLDPNFAWAYASRADALSQLKRYEDALADLNMAIDLSPDDSYSYIVRGDVKTNLNRASDASADYQKAVELSPTYAWAYIARGDNRTRLGKYKTALEDYDQAISFDANTDWFYFRRGMLNYMLGNYAPAETDFNKAISIQSKNKFYRVWLYFSEYKSKDKKTAVDNLKTFWKTAKAENPEFVGYIIRHITGELTDVQVVDSAQTFALQGVPENLCEGSFYIGMNAFVKGNEELAAKYWNYCLSTKVTNYIEYNYAETYLGKLKK